jgi:hypothetical protein
VTNAQTVEIVVVTQIEEVVMTVDHQEEVMTVDHQEVVMTVDQQEVVVTVEVDVSKVKRKHQENLEETRKKEEDHAVEAEIAEKIDFQKIQ